MKLFNLFRKKKQVNQSAGINIVSYNTDNKGKFNFQITGTKFVNPESWSILKNLEKNDEITIVHEPENKFDKNALALYFNGSKLGYIPKEVNADMRTITPKPEQYYNCFFVKSSDHEVPYTWVNCYPKK